MRTMVLLAGVVCSVLFPIFAGHALSARESGPVVTGVVLLLAGVVLLAIALRMADPSAERH